MNPKIRNLKLKIKATAPILALGSHTKNSVCLLKGRQAYFSPVLDDLGLYQDQVRFQSFVKYFLRNNPKVIAYDLHAGYVSSQCALSFPGGKFRLRAIQHHHAHIASCMAENYLDNSEVIGVSFDGTGLGLDNTLWGGEFLLCSYSNVHRAAHLKEVLLLGQESAIKEPARVLFSWLYSIYGDKTQKLIKGLDKAKCAFLKTLYTKKINSISSSSMGRLFDAAAALILDKSYSRHEGDLPMQLEQAACAYNAGAARSPGKIYHFRILKNQGYVIDPSWVFKQIIKDKKSKITKEEMAYKFHLAVASLITKICVLLRQDTQINKVILSGGVFQNKLLKLRALDLLSQRGFKVYTHKELSCSDSSLALGQAVIANFRR